MTNNTGGFRNESMDIQEHIFTIMNSRKNSNNKVQSASFKDSTSHQSKVHSGGNFSRKTNSITGNRVKSPVFETQYQINRFDTLNRPVFSSNNTFSTLQSDMGSLYKPT
jgi:hypothetical protein